MDLSPIRALTETGPIRWSSVVLYDDDSRGGWISDPATATDVRNVTSLCTVDTD